MRRINIVNVKMVKEGTFPYEVKRITTPQVAVDIAAKFLEGADREHLIIMTLDTKNNVTGISTVSVGSLNATVLHPREIFKIAILNNAASFLLVHNHPSGDPTPSPQDIGMAERVAEAGKFMGIEMLDFLIIGDGNHTSFKEQGRI